MAHLWRILRAFWDRTITNLGIQLEAYMNGGRAVAEEGLNKQGQVVDDVIEVVDTLLVSVLGNSYNAHSCLIGVRTHLDGFLDGAYPTEATVHLIAYDLMRIFLAEGRLVDALEALDKLEVDITNRLRSD